MRWLTYFILAYVMVGVQSGLGGFVEIWGARPDLVLICVIFIAMNAPRDAALLGAFVLGVLADLLSLNPLGLRALSYSLVAMFTLSSAPIVHRTHPLSHFSLAFVGSLLASIVILIHGLIHGPTPRITVLFFTALYTGVVAIFVLGILQRIRRIFAFQPKRMAATRSR
jgi:rod shape-determining protein MreD